MQNNKNMVLAVGPKGDLEVRLRTFVYDPCGKIVLEYRSDREHIGELGDLRRASLQDLISPDSNGQDIYSLALGRNPIRDTLLVRIGEYVVDGIINRSRNPNDKISKQREKKEFYEPGFRKHGFEAEDVVFSDDNGASEQKRTIDCCGFDRKLTPEEERGLFRRFNWLRYRLMNVQDSLIRGQNKFGYLNEMGNLGPQITAVRDKITRHNMGLVVSMARRINTNLSYDELISEGNLALFRSVDRFDYLRGFKFSTYAWNGILKAFSRVMSLEGRYKEHNPVAFDPTMERSHHLETVRNEAEGLYLEKLREVLKSGEAELDEAELRVIHLRFHLDGDNAEKRTLEEVGDIVGVSKERIRQIQNKALVKLKKAIEERVSI